jgi:hypothetical protein
MRDPGSRLMRWVGFETAHWSEPGYETTVITLDPCWRSLSEKRVKLGMSLSQQRKSRRVLHSHGLIALHLLDRTAVRMNP